MAQVQWKETTAELKETGQNLQVQMLISTHAFFFFFFLGTWHVELLTPPALEVWNPNHWITREVQFKCIFNF